MPSDLWSDGDLFQGASIALSKVLRTVEGIYSISKETIKTFPEHETTLVP
ncbi:MAG: hypothetical protein Roseis2KO_49750 [Roseivirga sp.]